LLAALGIANALNAWLYFRALSEAAVAPGAISHYLAPVLVALLAPVVLGEPSSRRTPVALVLALAGTVTLLAGGRLEGSGSVWHGVALGGGSAVFYAATVLVGKTIAGRFTDSELLSYHALVAALVLLPITGLPSEPDLWVLPTGGGLISGLLAGLLYYAGLRRTPAERVGVLTYTEVPAAVLVAWALGESPPPSAALGGVLVVAAGVLVVTADRR
jgi:drug/metabolite transporter (DMT)-like permease